jgi:hypothetical protein
MAPPIHIRLLPDGSGRVRIHWFQRTPDGPIRTPGRSEMLPPIGELKIGGAVGRIACMPRQESLRNVMKDGRIAPIFHSDDIHAVTCPECLALSKSTLQPNEGVSAT